MNTTKSKQAAYQAAYYLANKERLRASIAAYRAANRDKVLAYQAAWRAKNAAHSAAYREAHKEKALVYAAAYHAANRGKVLARQAAYRAANPGVMKASAAKWRAANAGKVKASTAKWRAANAGRYRASATAWQSKRYQTDPNFRIAATIRNHLHRIVKSGGVKDAASISYVGCTAAKLRRHLEKQFAPGMTWQNHGEWHIDHITPLSAFDFAAFPAQIKQAEHYTNLRPMWARDNINKGDAILRPVQLDLIAV